MLLAYFVGITGNFGQTNYVASKAGVIGMTRVWARELGKHNIRVNAIAPCQIRTPALDALVADPKFNSAKLIERFLTGIPMNRFGEAEDLVGPAIFLVSDAAAMVTGATLGVDGGNLALNGGGSHQW